MLKIDSEKIFHMLKFRNKISFEIISHNIVFRDLLLLSFRNFRLGLKYFHYNTKARKYLIKN